VEKSVASQRTGGAPTASDTPDGADPNGRDVRSALSQLELTGMAGLKRIEALLGACTRCPLHKTRRHIVFGEGDPAADVVFIGEAPGGEENRRGRPFVGPAGQLLDRMLKAMGLRREQVYIGNILKCRPPRNRDPEPAEMEICEPFLQAQLKAIQPAIIVTLGRIAAQNLLRTTTALGRLRGRLHDYQGMKLMPTYHPAYLLRQPTQKRPTWQDLQIVMAEMDRQGLKRKK
jgi:DNA polymerase